MAQTGLHHQDFTERMFELFRAWADAEGFVLVPRQQAARVASEAPDAAPAPAAPRDPIAPLPGADPRIEVVEDEDDDMMPDLEDTGDTDDDFVPDDIEPVASANEDHVSGPGHALLAIDQPLPPFPGVPELPEFPPLTPETAEQHAHAAFIIDRASVMLEADPNFDIGAYYRRNPLFQSAARGGDDALGGSQALNNSGLVAPAPEAAIPAPSASTAAPTPVPNAIDDVPVIQDDIVGAHDPNPTLFGATFVGEDGTPTIHVSTPADERWYVVIKGLGFHGIVRGAHNYAPLVGSIRGAQGFRTRTREEAETAWRSACIRGVTRTL